MRTSSVQEIDQLRIHGVEPRFVQEARRLGYDFTPKELAQLRMHGVDGAYLKRSARRRDAQSECRANRQAPHARRGLGSLHCSLSADGIHRPRRRHELLRVDLVPDPFIGHAASHSFGDGRIRSI